jgi:hypothetical protein
LADKVAKNESILTLSGFKKANINHGFGVRCVVR